MLFSDLEGVGEVRRCPVSYLTPEVRDVMKLWPLWEKGLLPVGGGVLDQAASAIDAFGLIDSMINKYNRKRAEEAERERNHGR